MTEIQWLCDILLNFKLQKPIKDRFIARIGEVEAQLTKPTVRMMPSNPIGVPVQAPSTQRLLEEMAQQTGAPVDQVAHTQAAAQALQARQEAIRSAGKTEPGRTSPRKF